MHKAPPVVGNLDGSVSSSNTTSSEELSVFLGNNENPNCKGKSKTDVEDDPRFDIPSLVDLNCYSPKHSIWQSTRVW